MSVCVNNVLQVKFVKKIPLSLKMRYGEQAAVTAFLLWFSHRLLWWLTHLRNSSTSMCMASSADWLWMKSAR